MPSFPTVWVCLSHTKAYETTGKKNPNPNPRVKPEFLKKPINFYFFVYFQYKEDSFEVRSLLIHGVWGWMCSFELLKWTFSYQWNPAEKILESSNLQKRAEVQNFLLCWNNSAWQRCHLQARGRQQRYQHKLKKSTSKAIGKSTARKYWFVIYC